MAAPDNMSAFTKSIICYEHVIFSEIHNQMRICPNLIFFVFFTHLYLYLFKIKMIYIIDCIFCAFFYKCVNRGKWQILTIYAVHVACTNWDQVNICKLFYIHFYYIY